MLSHRPCAKLVGGGTTALSTLFPARPTPSPTLEAHDLRAGPVVDVAGTPIRLTASDEPRAEAVAAVFRHAARTNAPPRGVLRFTADALDCPSSPPTSVIDDVQVWRPEPDHLWLRSAEGMSAHVTPDEILVGGDAPLLAREFRFIALIALSHLLARQGKHVLHAGAVVADGQTILVLGDTGSGKSTLVLSALQLGWPALGDDMVALHEVDGIVQAEGLPRPISVPHDVFTLEMPGTRRLPRDGRRRTELSAASRATGVHPLSAVIVTSHGSDRDAVIAPMPGHDVLRAALGASTSTADPAFLPEVFALAARIARTPAWSLAHGAGPTSRLDSAGRKLEEIRRQVSARNGARRG